MEKQKDAKDAKSEQAQATAAAAATAQTAAEAAEKTAGDDSKEGEESLGKQLADYKESLQRLQAEFENYKKRAEKEKAQFRQLAAAEAAKNFLPVLDSFELALKSINSTKNEASAATAAVATANATAATAQIGQGQIAHSAYGGIVTEGKVIKGLELIYAQFYSVLESQGLRPIKAVGERFDPYRHEVLMQEATADEKKDGIIVEEFQKGYAFNAIVLRYSKVKVLKFAKVNAAEK